MLQEQLWLAAHVPAPAAGGGEPGLGLQPGLGDPGLGLALCPQQPRAAHQLRRGVLLPPSQTHIPALSAQSCLQTI